jgi:hypothetical protein
MKSKIIIIVVGSVLALIVGLALANTATEPVLPNVALAKGCDCLGPYLSVDKLVQPPPQKPKTPINPAPKGGDRTAGGSK